MMKKFFLLLIIAVTVIFSSCSNNKEEKNQTHIDSKDNPATEYYTCPMHPSVISDKPGACPVCGMALVKKSRQQEASQNEIENVKSITLSPTQQVLANVATQAVIKTSSMRTISAVGVVDYAEPNQLKVAARFRGRIEKLYVNFTGREVQRGEPLFELHSPELISAEQDLILAASSVASPSALISDAESRKRTLEAARERLHVHFGLTHNQINEMEASKQPRMTVIFYSPMQGTVITKDVQEGQYVDEGMVLYQLADLSSVWIYLDVYEKDIRFMKKGTLVEFTGDTYPGKTFHGKITFIDPVINEQTRTVRVRVASQNPDRILKPNMFVQARIKIPFSSNIIIPTSAIIATGHRSVVWVESKPNVFEPRDVVVGSSSDGKTEILAGLSEGELIAVSGGYLIDSESALREPAAADPHTGHMATNDSRNEKSTQKAHLSHSSEKQKTESNKTIQDFHITVDGNYTPDIVYASTGKKIRLHFTRHEDSECTNEVVFEKFNIRQKLPPHQTVTIEINPQKTGKYEFHCGMDMVRGTLIVEDGGGGK